MDANVCCLDFESVCGVIGESCYEFGCVVGKANMFVHEGDQDTTTLRNLSCVRDV